MEKNNELKKVGIKNHLCYYFDDMIKIADFDFNNILLNKKSYENIFIMMFHAKCVLMQNLCLFCLIRWICSVEVMMELKSSNI